jgi:2-polyprenyl-6-hydroxyphenyl methylase/3-demethylubiquinone-9 3-methyltransferase
MEKPAFDDGGWWDEDGFLYGLNTLLGPVREAYVTEALGRAGHDPGSRVLDLGSGGGFLSAALSDAGYRVIGIDPSLYALQDATARVRGHFATAVGESLPFSDGRFDAVVASEVLEHVDNVPAVLSEIGRVLRREGIFVFSLPNRTWLSRLVLIDLAQRFPPTRLLPADLHDWDKFIRPEEFKEMARRDGLVVSDIRSLSIPPGEILGAARALLALRRGRISYAEAGRRIHLGLSANKAIAYMGTATRV